MEELLASQTKKLILPSRGQQVEGTVVSQTAKEIILDLSSKSEGVLLKRELENHKALKLGDKITAFVTLAENESGQVVLSLERQVPTHLEGARALLRGGSSRGGKSGGGRSLAWHKFIQAQNQKTKIQATVLEVNKGGLIVEADGIRGFLPNSQVGFELISKSGQGMEGLIGQTLSLTVIEVDIQSNKLIFTQRGQVLDSVKEQLKTFKTNLQVQGKIVAILPFGLVVDVAGVEGLVFISDVSWEKVDDLSKQFATGQELDVLVIGIDEDLGRLNLSIKQLLENPFNKLSEKYSADSVVKGEITSVTEAGVSVKLKDTEGFLPASKMGSPAYEVGKSMSFLVDSVDSQRRRVNLAPFVTSTAGLIYK